MDVIPVWLLTFPPTLTSDPRRTVGMTIAASGNAPPVSRIAGARLQDDRALARECASGSPAAFEQLWTLMGERLRRIAFQHLGSLQDAEDAVQETLIKVHRSAGSFQGDSSFSTWVTRILMNTCTDMIRYRGRRPEATLDEHDLSGFTTGISTAALELRRMLANLTPQRRAVFILFEVEGLSHAEIASVLGIRDSYSKWLLFDVKRELRERWSEGRKS